MGKLRTSSLCSTCSSRSDIFFYQDKALVAFETCAEMLAYCFPSIDRIVKTLDITYTFYTMIVEFQKIDKLDVNLDESVKAADHSFKQIRKSEIDCLR